MFSSISDSQGKLGFTLPGILQDISVPSWKTPTKTNEAQQRLEPSKSRENFTNLDDALLLNIFNYLPLTDLARASQVCQRWYGISFDTLLWSKVDLRRFSGLLGDKNVFERFAKSRLSTKVYELDLTGLVLTEKNMNIIAVHCTNLRSLTLKCVTFRTFQTSNSQDTKDTRMLIPKRLESLDIRFSKGLPSVFSSIALQLDNVKSLGVCDGFLQTLIVSNKLESTIARLKNSLENMDMSQCLLATDWLLELFVRCRKLKVLSLRKCNGVFGKSLKLVLQNCPHLETLILDGTSIEDIALEKMQWGQSLLKHLELGWCPLLTSASLKITLPQIAQIPTLEYLGLCLVGQGKALTGDVLASFAANLSDGPHRSLKCINIGPYHGVTNEALQRFTKCHPNIAALMVPKSHDHPNKRGVLGHKDQLLSPKRTIPCWSVAVFLPQRYALETPL